MNRKQRRAAKRRGHVEIHATGQGRPPGLHAEVSGLFRAAFADYQAGRSAKAEELCRAIHEIDPNHPGALQVLSLVAHERGNLDRAAELLRRAIVLDPARAASHNNLGVVLCKMGRCSDGIASYRRAIALDPAYAVAHSNLGAAYTGESRPEEAIVECEKAIELQPDYADAHYNLATAYHRQGRWKEAVAQFETALRVNPNHVDAKFALCMAELPVLFDDEPEIASRRDAYARRLQAFVDGQGRLADLAGGVGTAQPFQLAYQGRNDRELQSLYGAFVCRVMADRYPASGMAAPALPGERVRVGIVSGYFRRHSNWKIPIKGWVSQIDRSRFEVFGYHTGTTRDRETDAAAALCDRFVQGPLAIDDWRRVILSDAPHVLIYPEIGMDPVAVKLAAQRLAPVQCNSWGHPETSGFPTIDYYLSSELMEPADAQSHYSERLVSLPNLSVFYESAATEPAVVSWAERGLRPSGKVFWCGQSLFKYLPRFDIVFPRIAREVGDCQFAFIHFPGGAHIRTLFERRLDWAFGEAGLKSAEYCVILPHLDPGSFAALMQRSDVVLDTIGWSGCNSTLESLQFDLPSVTMPGTLMRSRHTMAIFSMMNIPQVIANTVDEYIEIAVRLAKDDVWRTEIRNAIAANKHRLYCDRACVAALEDFLVRVARPGGDAPG